MSSASAWTSDSGGGGGVTQVPLPAARMKTSAVAASHPTHADLATLPIITLSSRGSSDPRSAAGRICRTDDPGAAEGPRCLSLPLSRVQDQVQQRQPKQQKDAPAPPPPPSYTNCSSSLDNLSLFSPSDPGCLGLGGGGLGGGGGGGRLIKASSDNPVYGLSASPPVPPRDYIPRAASRPTVFIDLRQAAGGASAGPGSAGAARPEIHPIVQDGQKRSNTHYWLLPDKQKTSISLDDVDKMTCGDEQHYVNLAANGHWARKFGIAKAPSFGGQKKSTGGASRKEEPRRNHHVSEGTTDSTGPRSVFYADTVPLLSDVSSLDSVSIAGDLPMNDEDAGTRRCPSSQEEDDRTTSMGEVKEMIDVVRSKIDGVTSDESFTALATHQWNVQAAVEYLKVENLFRLGLASRERCRRKLEINNWNLERAASDLLDLIQLDSCK